MRELERNRSNASWRRGADTEIRNALAGLDALASAGCVGGYVPMKGEVDLTPLCANLAENGTRICLPRSIGAAKNEKSMRGVRKNAGNTAYVMAGVALESLMTNGLLMKGMFGIPEPFQSTEIVPNSDVDVWLVPALAFDEQGNRLGRGGGFYDRFLAESAGLRIGVGYEQMVLNDKLPCDEWDQRMDVIVTERRQLWIYGRK